MRLACAFDGRDYRYFLPAETEALLAMLHEADEVITFNGKSFDELVLRKHHGLKGKFPVRGTHTDLCEIIYRREGRGVSLNALAELNLGEPKHTKGHRIASLDLKGLKLACLSDVSQTHRLWELWKAGNSRSRQRAWVTSVPTIQLKLGLATTCLRSAQAAMR
jgi:hypothetical protein